MKTPFGLTQATINKICSVLTEHSQVDSAVIYGSRAKGNYKPGSDIDLTLFGDTLKFKDLTKISDELDDLLLPYTIDLSIFNMLENTKLCEHIERVGKVLYQREVVSHSRGVMKVGGQMKRLGEVCEVIAGQSPEGRYYNNEMQGLPFYQGKKEFSEKFIGDPTTWTTDVTKEARQGDILLSVRAPVGPVNFATQRMCIGRGLAAIRATKLIDCEFLFNFLLKHESEIVGNPGAVFNSINKTQIENIPIPLPPLTEQRRIVAILDQAFEGIATAKANAKKNLVNAREVFESILQSVFENKGEGWEEKTLNQIAENLDNKRIPITKDVRSSGAYPYFGASGIVDYVNEFIFDDDLLLVSEDGANLLARTYPLAFSISGKTWVNNHAHVLRFKEMATQKLVEFYLNSIPFDDYVSGMAQPKLNQKMLNTIPVPFPPLVEQHAIVAKLNNLSIETKKLESIYQRKLAALDELKKSLLHQAFSEAL